MSLFADDPQNRQQTTLAEFRRALVDAELRTDPEKTVTSYSKNVLNITAYNRLGQAKTYGGDQWIARLRTNFNRDDNLEVYILPNELKDFENGQYQIIE